MIVFIKYYEGVGEKRLLKYCCVKIMDMLWLEEIKKTFTVMQ